MQPYRDSTAQTILVWFQVVQSSTAGMMTAPIDYYKYELMN